jgi:hypothetical protein
MANGEPLLFVPAQPVHEPDLAPYGLEVRQLADGRYGCTAYSTVERLVEALGMYQPWVAISARELVGFLDRVGVERLYVDTPLPDEAWRWQPGQAAELAAEEAEWQPVTK